MDFFFSLKEKKNCFSFETTVCPDYKDKSSWMTLSEMNLMFSALFFHIRSHFCICHNFQPFLQKTESFLFADIISALYNPLEECEARFVHRKGWAEWGKGKTYGQKSCNSCLFPRFSFARHLTIFMGNHFSFINIVWAGKNIKWNIFPWDLQGQILPQRPLKTLGTCWNKVLNWWEVQDSESVKHLVPVPIDIAITTISQNCLP